MAFLCDTEGSNSVVTYKIEDGSRKKSRQFQENKENILMLKLSKMSNGAVLQSWTDLYCWTSPEIRFRNWFCPIVWGISLRNSTHRATSFWAKGTSWQWQVQTKCEMSFSGYVHISVLSRSLLCFHEYDSYFSSNKGPLLCCMLTVIFRSQCL